ncbi:MAG: ribonuclease R [Nitrospinae bacterium]|nr:ribonuclease R [Nitrospinota bacterium]
MAKHDELFEILRSVLSHPLTEPEIRRSVPKKFRAGLDRRLSEFEKSGEIIQIRYGRYGLAEHMNLVTGKVQGHADGFGFVIPETEGQKDVYIGPQNFREAMHGDRVVCRIEGHRRDGKPEGRVIRVLARAVKTVTGIYQSRGRGGVIVPAQKRVVQDFLVPPGKSMQAKSGEVVVGSIVQYPDAHQTAEAVVIEKLGYPDDPVAERRVIIRQYELEEEFPPAVLKMADKIAEPADRDCKGRLDLRGEWVVTIDGEDAKDFDDAISIKSVPYGWELGVHIADVSNYVSPDTALDLAAYQRGTSTYFPGFVLPMLPFNLSNNVCSLKPHVDRLTLSAIMTLNASAEVTGYRFTPSVINSAHRMTYTAVAEILANPAVAPDKASADNLVLMNGLAKKIFHNRVRAGGLDFELPESKIIIGAKGEPEKIIRSDRNDAHRLIEEFMLSANRCAANFLADEPSLYRIHPSPDPVAVAEFFEFAGRLGYVTSERLELKYRLQELLKLAHGHPDEKLINFIMLRHMKQAGYSPNNIGHFGLAFAEYTHFTSPIRRYPDLIVHRLIKEKLKGAPRYLDLEGLSEAGRHCSERERVSEKAERDVTSMLKVRYMAGREGEEFDGVITGVTAFGIFVEMTDVFVEGLVRLTDMHDDYYDYRDKEHMLVGKRRGKIFRLGGAMRVRLKHVDILKKEITLEPASEKPGAFRGKRGEKGGENKGKKFDKNRGKGGSGKGKNFKNRSRRVI